jgi:hypothetical protein
MTNKVNGTANIAEKTRVPSLEPPVELAATHAVEEMEPLGEVVPLGHDVQVVVLTR